MNLAAPTLKERCSACWPSAKLQGMIVDCYYSYIMQKSGSQKIGWKNGYFMYHFYCIFGYLKLWKCFSFSVIQYCTKKNLYFYLFFVNYKKEREKPPLCCGFVPKCIMQVIIYTIIIIINILLHLQLLQSDNLLPKSTLQFQSKSVRSEWMINELMNKRIYTFIII